MELAEFESHLAAARSKRAALSSAGAVDVFEGRLASAEELLQVEAALDAQLPVEYKEFMRRYGGGMFLFLDLLPVASADPYEDDLLGVKAREFGTIDFVAVAPVGTGDWWGFSIAAGRCLTEVHFWDHEDGKTELVAPGFLDFVAREGLRVGS